MFSCASCSENHTDGPCCSVCKQRYDFACSGITEAGYRKLGERKSTWRCLRCKSSLSPSPVPSSPQTNQLDRMQQQLSNILMQLTQLAPLIEDVKFIREEVNNLKDSQETVHQLLTTVSDKVNSLESRVIKVEKIAHEVPILQAEISKMRDELETRDQWSRSNNIEVRGIPQKNNENLFDIALKIGQLCDFPIKKDHINYIARIPTRSPNKEKPIIIALHNRYFKEELVALSRKSDKLKLENLGFTSSGKVYLNDHLTQRNKSLLNKAKSMAKERNFKYVWVKHSKIMVRKSDTSPILFIKNENDLKKIE
ncbi:uncharacterized protein LOC121737969 [Aricia agestis]|uniref:uncharacterized protein LOC121737969 n=1 Tax=Aricia agestis TaxID=91739 RepID=UPI001C209C07|nr:uncharacterized protein LOC121737969 [Aricia agestis]